jgi:hypothetical protein
MDLSPYSPDLAPADFWLFPKLKRMMKGQRFSDAEREREMTRIPVLDFRNCFEQW